MKYLPLFLLLSLGCITIERPVIVEPQRCECVCPEEDSCPDGAICGFTWNENSFDVTATADIMLTDVEGTWVGVLEYPCWDYQECGHACIGDNCGDCTTTCYE